MTARGLASTTYDRLRQRGVKATVARLFLLDSLGDGEYTTAALALATGRTTHCAWKTLMGLQRTGCVRSRWAGDGGHARVMWRAR